MQEKLLDQVVSLMRRTSKEMVETMSQPRAPIHMEK